MWAQTNALESWNEGEDEGEGKSVPDGQIKNTYISIFVGETRIHARHVDNQCP